MCTTESRSLQVCLFSASISVYIAHTTFVFIVIHNNRFYFRECLLDSFYVFSLCAFRGQVVTVFSRENEAIHFIQLISISQISVVFVFFVIQCKAIRAGECRFHAISNAKLESNFIFHWITNGKSNWLKIFFIFENLNRNGKIQVVEGVSINSTKKSFRIRSGGKTYDFTIYTSHDAHHVSRNEAMLHNGRHWKKK